MKTPKKTVRTIILFIAGPEKIIPMARSKNLTYSLLITFFLAQGYLKKVSESFRLFSDIQSFPAIKRYPQQHKSTLCD